MPVNVKKVILSDLDSTIACTLHRHHLLPTHNTDSDWQKYALASLDDKPIRSTITALQLYAKYGHPVHIISGRADIALDITHAWLSRHQVPYEELRLYRHAPENLKTSGLHLNVAHKINYIRELQKRDMEVALMFEDSEYVASQIEAETGVPVIRVQTPSSSQELRSLNDR